MRKGKTWFFRAVTVLLVAGAIFLSPELSFPYEEAKVEFTCPISGTVFTSERTLSSSTFGSRLDLRPLGAVFAPSPLPVCPTDGFVLYKDEYPEEELSKLKGFVASKDYPRHAPPYVRLARIYEYLGYTDEWIAVAYLKASWAAEGRKAPLDPLLEKSLTHLLSYLFTEREKDPTWVMYQALAVELERRLGRFDAAKMRLLELKKTPDLEEKYTLAIIPQQLELIDKKDRDPHKVRHPCDQSKEGRAAAESLQGAEGKGIAELLSILQGGKYFEERKLAALKLGEMYDPITFASLLDALQDQCPAVQVAAASSLGSLGEERAVVPLMEWFVKSFATGKTSGKSLYGAISSSGELVVEPLIALLKNEDWRLRLAAVKALSEIGDPRAVKPLVGLFGDRQWMVVEAAVYALEPYRDPGLVEPLIGLFDRSSVNSHMAAAHVLGEIGDPRAVEPLLSALKAEFKGTRVKAAGALGKIGDPRATEPLIAALADEDWNVSAEAATALGKLGDLRAITPLIEITNERVGSVSGKASKALLQILDITGSAPFRDALTERDRSNLYKAMKIKEGRTKTPLSNLMVALGDSNAIGYLAAGLKDRLAGSAWMKAVAELDYIDPQWRAHREVRPVIEECIDRLNNYENESLKCARVLTIIGEPAVEPLIAELKSAKPMRRSLTASCLAEISDPRALQPLRELIRERGADLIYSAMANRWKVTDQGVTEALIGAIDEVEYAGQRSGIAKILGKIRDPLAVPTLIELAETDENTHVQATAAVALGKIGGFRAAEVLLSLLAHEKASVGNAAAEGLGTLRYAPAVQSLAERLRIGDRALAASRALGRIESSEATEALLQAASGQGDQKLRVAAIQALGAPHHGEAVEGLLSLLEDDSPEIRLAAVEAMGRLKAERAREYLYRAMKDQDESVGLNAAVALAGLKDRRAIDSLKTILKNSKKRRALGPVVRALAAVGGNSIIPVLLESFHAGNGTQSEVVEALSDIGTPEAVDALILLSGENNRWISDLAFMKLRELTGQKVGWSTTAWERWWEDHRREWGGRNIP